MSSIESLSPTSPESKPPQPSESSWEELTKLSEDYDLPAAKVSSAMKKFSDDYEAAREKAYEDFLERQTFDANETFNFHPDQYSDRSRHLLGLEDMIDIIKKNGLSEKIPRDLIQTFGNSLVDSALRSEEWDEMPDEDRESLKQTIGLLRERGFDPSEDGRNLEDLTWDSIVTEDLRQRADFLGVVDVDSDAKISEMISKLSKIHTTDDFRDANAFAKTISTASKLLSDPSLSQEQKDKLLHAFPPSYQGYIAYSRRVGGRNKSDLPESINPLDEEYFTPDGPTEKFWQTSFDNGNFSQINAFAKKLDPETDQEIFDYNGLKLSDDQIQIMELYNQIKIPEFSETFALWYKINHETAPSTKVDIVAKIFRRLPESDSPEISHNAMGIIEQLLAQDYEEATLVRKTSEIEKLFSDENLPHISKAFATFQLLHPPETLPSSNLIAHNSYASPALIALANENKGNDMAGMLYSDLFLAAAGSNSESLRKAMSDNPQVLEYMDRKIAEADARNREAAKRPFRLEGGDMIKGLGSVKYLPDTLQNGAVCKEFLGEDSQSDATPLDTDLSLIERNAQSFESGLNGLQANAYGPLWLVLKADENRDGPDRFSVTRRAPSETDKPTAVTSDYGKLEVFYTNHGNQTHMGIRTGFASSEIDFFVAENAETADAAKIEIVKNGFYIPIVDKHSGGLIFTPEQYDQMRNE